MSGCLRIRIMCPNVATCLLAVCCFIVLTLVQTDIIIISSHSTCSRHDQAEIVHLALNNNNSLTHPLSLVLEYCVNLIEIRNTIHHWQEFTINSTQMEKKHRLLFSILHVMSSLYAYRSDTSKHSTSSDQYCSTCWTNSRQLCYCFGH